MRQLRLPYLAALAAVLLGALAASPASATILTDGSGKQLAAGTIIKAENESFPVFDWAWPEILCTKSTLEAEVTSAGGAESTVVAQIRSLTFSECGGTNCPVVALKNGELIIHTEGALSNGNGTVTSSGLELTTQCSNVHCTWTTLATDAGVIKGGSPASLWISMAYPRLGGESGVLCGNSQRWTAIYKITSPGSLSVD